MKPSVALHQHREALRALASRFRAGNLRVFGSALTGEETGTSDIDLLVDPLPETTLFDLGGLQIEAEALLGVRVDLVTPGDLPPQWRAEVLAQAQPV